MWRSLRLGPGFGCHVLDLPVGQRRQAGEECGSIPRVRQASMSVVMPDDVHPRYEWLIAFKKMGVRVFSESSFVQMLSGFLPLDGVMPRELTFLRSKRR